MKSLFEAIHQNEKLRDRRAARCSEKGGERIARGADQRVSARSRGWRLIRRGIPVLLLFATISSTGSVTRAQEMEARAYSPAPVGANVALFVYAHQTGDVLFDPALPLSDVKVKLNSTVLGYGRTFNFAGRQATASVALPYVWGTVSGTIFEQAMEVSRSGLGDPRVRLAVNLMGSPAMSPREFAARKPETQLGASLTVIIPSGQYDPRRLVNIGSNRLALKPELGLSHPVGRWTFEAVGGAWFFTDNDDFFSGGVRREQNPLISFQGHVIYTIRPRMWVAGNATFYTGGRTTVNGTLNSDLQRNSRIGATFSYPVTQAHSLKVSWAKGVTARVGGDLNTIAIGWQYTWLK